MEQAYVLRLYDTDLLSFSLSEQGIEGLKAQIHSIDEEERALFPLDLELTDDGLVKWPVPERQLLGGAPGFYRDICPVQSI